MNLDDMRAQIDSIDEEMVRLFCRRMEIVRDVAEYKRANRLPVLHSGRERQVLDRAAALAGPEQADRVRVLFTMLMDLSKAQQQNQLSERSPFSQRLEDLLENSPSSFPERPVVACQGVEGAYSSLAARRLFADGQLQFVPEFEDVFRLIQDGGCDFGVLPLENSTAGSVHQVYDLMRHYEFHIVRSLKLNVSHCLLGLPGAALDTVTEVHSHEQALRQCGAFFARHPQIRPRLASNTAAAAQEVRRLESVHHAAIASPACAELYGLQVLEDRICDVPHNETRFIAIGRDAVMTDPVNRISVALTLPHEPGSLYRLITKFAMLHLNLTKLESCPLPNTDFEFLFYFDFEGSIASAPIRALLCELEQQCDYFVFLGNYQQL